MLMKAMCAFWEQMPEGQGEEDTAREGVGKAQCELVLGNLLGSNRDEPANHVQGRQEGLEDNLPHVEG